MRTPFGEYPEYHTSADNLEFISLEALSDSLTKCVSALEILESNQSYISQNPKCEPQLGRRGLYQTVGGGSKGKDFELALLWVLSLSDGNHTLLDIAEKSGLEFGLVKTAAGSLLEQELLKESSRTVHQSRRGS